MSICTFRRVVSWKIASLMCRTMTAGAKPNIFGIKGKYVKCYTRPSTYWSHLKTLLCLLSSAQPHGKLIHPRHKIQWKNNGVLLISTLREQRILYAWSVQRGAMKPGGHLSSALRIKQWKVTSTLTSTLLLCLQLATSRGMGLFVSLHWEVSYCGG